MIFQIYIKNLKILLPMSTIATISANSTNSSNSSNSSNSMITTISANPQDIVQDAVRDTVPGIKGPCFEGKEKCIL